MNPIVKTRNWLKHFIIKFNICPFAKYPFENNTIRYHLSKVSNEIEILNEIWKEIFLLTMLDSKYVSTTLFITPKFQGSFEDFNEFVNILNFELKIHQMDKHYQLVAFHPHFYFGDENKNDLSNLVNRSPFPLIHIIRQNDIDQALKNYPNVLEVPLKNKNLIQSLDQKEIKKILKIIS